MAVTGVSPAPHDAVRAQVDRVVSSEILKNSDSLCRLLRYLAGHAVDQPGVSIKEYQIATEVFGRAIDFDPRLDSTVRVQTGRLRSKLAEYYASTGASDRLILDLPKGSYSLTVSRRPSAEPPVAPAHRTAPAVPAARPAAQPRTPTALLWVLGALCLGLLTALLAVLFTRSAPTTSAPARAPAELRTLWAGFTESQEWPLVVFSNAAFVGRPETGMRYFDANRDRAAAILDHYTGVGEVLAIHELDRLFEQFGRGIHVKRARLLSIDDAKNNDLIFVGSPSENLALRDIPGTSDFVFRVAESGPRKGDLAIVNVRPRAGESAEFLASAATPTTEDYALIGFFPGMNPSRCVMTLAGTTTIGTQAAVEFVTREHSVHELVAKAGSTGGPVSPFEAVLRVSIKGGVPVATEIVAFRRRAAQQ